MKLSRPVIFLGALAPVAIAVLGVLLLPWLIDSRLVRDKISSELVRRDGKMLIADEVDVDSPQVNLSGQGEVDMERKRIDGKGLVAVLKPVDEVLARIPGISATVTGSLVGIPIRVAGPIDRPEVTYLSPTDVGVELLNIPLRILGMPLGAIRLFTPSGNQRDQDISK